MPRWDYRCDSCGRTTTIAYTNAEERDKVERHDPSVNICGQYLEADGDQPGAYCAGTLERQAAAPNFAIR